MLNENRVAVFTVVSDQYYYPVGTHKFINSFLKFHQEENIDLIVFRQDVIDKVFSEHGLNFYNARPTFAKLLVEKGYGLIVAIDADYAIFGRLDAVLADDYEVGCATNYNQFENRSVENVTEKEFVQAGLVASRNPKFWDIWERENSKAMQYVCKENDILSLIWKNDPEVTKMKQKVFDKDTPDYYGCKSLGQEEKMYLKDDKVMLNKGQVVAYHQARGAKFPKLDFFDKSLGFTYEVASYWEKLSMEGVSVKYAKSLFT